MRFLALLLLSSVAVFAAIIDPSRLPTDSAWQNAGVPGGIPNRTTIFQTLSPGDDIQTAINNCPSGQVVKLNAGTYTLSTELAMKANMTLRGAGPTLTKLEYNGTAGIALIFIHGGNIGSKVNITGGTARGATSFTTGSTTGLSTGSYVLITHNNPSFVTARSYGNSANIANWLSNDSGGLQNMCQLVKVTGVSGGTVTFTPALYLDMTNSPTYQIEPMMEGAGVEDLSLKKTAITGDNANLNFQRAAGCWAKNVDSLYGERSGIQLNNCWGCTVTGCVVDNSNFAVNHDSGRSYGIFVFDPNSNHLIENNITIGCRHGVVYEGGGSGVVVAYNAIMRSKNGEVGNGSRVTEDFDTHGAHPYMNLHEGNYSSRMVRDSTWGSSSHNLDFRGWASGWTAEYLDSNTIFWRNGILVNTDSHLNSFVGCVLLRPGDNTKDYGPDFYATDSFEIGLINDWGSGYDSTVIADTYLHGVYSYKELATTWDGSNADHSIPNSMYRSVQPSFWDSGPWPGIGPDLSNKIAGNPALRRHTAFVDGGSTDRSLLFANATGGVSPATLTVGSATVGTLTLP